jgi:hypothetical protein
MKFRIAYWENEELWKSQKGKAIKAAQGIKIKTNNNREKGTPC